MPGKQARCTINQQLRVFSSLVSILQNLLMFNATAGYLTDPYQAHRTVACMYGHIQNLNRPLAQKILLISPAQFKKQQSKFPYNHYILL
jgi:hypothetical protein